MKAFEPCQHFGFLSNRVGKLIQLQVRETIIANGYQFPSSCIGILAQLWSEDGISQKDLSISLFKNKSSITKMILALERDQMIVRKEDEQDKRYKKIFLTPRGNDFRKDIEHYNQQLNKQLRKHYNQKDIQLAKEILSTTMQLLSKEII